MCYYFGKYGLTGGSQECEKTVKTVFNALNDEQKDYFLYFDEIHIKPGLQYQGKHVSENALNTSVPTAGNFMFAAMSNPSYGTLAFIACLVPVKIFTAEFLHDVVKVLRSFTLLEVMSSASCVTVCWEMKSHIKCSMKKLMA